MRMSKQSSLAYNLKHKTTIGTSQRSLIPLLPLLKMAILLSYHYTFHFTSSSQSFSNHVFTLSAFSLTSIAFFHLCMVQQDKARSHSGCGGGGLGEAGAKSRGERRVLGIEGEVQGRHKSSGEGEASERAYEAFSG